MKRTNLGSIAAKLIAAVMLFAALGHHEYDYYTLLRLVVCVVAAFTAFQASQIKKTGWLIVFVIIAAIHNPFAPIHLKRDSWALIDITCALLLLLSIASLDVRKQGS